MPTTTTDDDYTYELPIPVISNLANTIPTFYGTISGEVTATTDINANCRWSLTNQTYTSMTNNFTTGQADTDHETTVTGLTGGLNTIYVSCASPTDPTHFSVNSTTAVTIDTVPYMQSFTTAVCDNMAINQVMSLVDRRDNKPYNIIKLKMGATDSIAKCWMQQNLALENKTLTSADSNVNSNFTLGTVQTTAPASVETVVSPAYKPTSDCRKIDGTGSLVYVACSSAGYLYNWAAAVAYSNTHYGGSNSQILTSGNAQYSICPKNWRLPIGGASNSVNEFSLVDRYSYGGTGNNQANATVLAGWANPAGFAVIYAGTFDSSAFQNQGNAAYFWSSSVYDGMRAYNLFFYPNNNFVYPLN
jgi:uncharacterized protein (TIGR02145 family)